MLLITLGVNALSVTLFDQIAGGFAFIFVLPILVFLIIVLLRGHKTLSMRVCATIFYGYLVLSNSYAALVNFEVLSFALILLGAFGFMTSIDIKKVNANAS